MDRDRVLSRLDSYARTRLDARALHPLLLELAEVVGPGSHPGDGRPPGTSCRPHEPAIHGIPRVSLPTFLSLESRSRPARPVGARHDLPVVSWPALVQGVGEVVSGLPAELAAFPVEWIDGTIRVHDPEYECLDLEISRHGIRAKAKKFQGEQRTRPQHPGHSQNDFDPTYSLLFAGRTQMVCEGIRGSYSYAGAPCGVKNRAMPTSPPRTISTTVPEECSHATGSSTSTRKRMRPKLGYLPPRNAGSSPRAVRRRNPPQPGCRKTPSPPRKNPGAPPRWKDRWDRLQTAMETRPYSSPGRPRRRDPRRFPGR